MPVDQFLRSLQEAIGGEGEREVMKRKGRRRGEREKERKMKGERKKKEERKK